MRVLDKSGSVCFNGSMPEATVTRCGCGCGAEVARRYLPGHDAKHKAALVAAANDATTRQAADRAIDQLIELGWTRYAEAATLRAYQPRRGGRPTTHRNRVAIWLVGPDHTHHARHGCRQLTRTAKAAGLINPITGVAMQAAITRVPTSRHLLANMGFDACTECTHEETLDTLTDWVDMGRLLMLAIYDRDGMTRNGNRKAGTPKPPADPQATPNLKIQTWTVEPDPIPPTPQPTSAPDRAAWLARMRAAIK